MSIHNDINTQIREVIAANDHADILSVTFVATAAYQSYGKPEDELHIRYGCIEHFKQMARAELRSRFGAEGKNNQAHQDDMFSGKLQDRYPVPVPAGDEPFYKRRELMTARELEWNVRQLEKSADARVQHATALRAYMDMRQAA